MIHAVDGMHTGIKSSSSVHTALETMCGLPDLLTCRLDRRKVQTYSTQALLKLRRSQTKAGV